MSSLFSCVYVLFYCLDFTVHSPVFITLEFVVISFFYLEAFPSRVCLALYFVLLFFFTPFLIDLPHLCIVSFPLSSPVAYVPQFAFILSFFFLFSLCFCLPVFGRCPCLLDFTSAAALLPDFGFDSDSSFVLACLKCM